MSDDSAASSSEVDGALAETKPKVSATKATAEKADDKPEVASEVAPPDAGAAAAGAEAATGQSAPVETKSAETNAVAEEESVFRDVAAVKDGDDDLFPDDAGLPGADASIVNWLKRKVRGATFGFVDLGVMEEDPERPNFHVSYRLAKSRRNEQSLRQKLEKDLYKRKFEIVKVDYQSILPSHPVSSRPIPLSSKHATIFHTLPLTLFPPPLHQQHAKH